MALNTLTLASSNLSGSGTVAVNGLTAGSTVTLTNNPEGAFFFDGANLIYNLVSSYPRTLHPVLLERLGTDQGQAIFTVNVAGAFAPGPTLPGGVDTVARAAAADAKANPTLTQATVTAAGDKTARDAAVDAKANPTLTSAAIVAAGGDTTARDAATDAKANPTLTLAKLAPLSVQPYLVNNVADLMGDSRTADENVNLTPIGQTGVHWLNHYNAQNGNRIIVGTNQGYSGARSDQYLKGLSSTGAQVRIGMDALAASSAAWAIFGYPIVNDLAQSAAGYTDQVSGTIAVTASNVADVAFANIKAAVLRLLALGKRVIVTPEPGATNLPAAAIGQMHRFNYLLRRFAETTDRVFIWNPLRAIWAATSSTGITMLPNVMRNPGTVDPTHYSVFGGMMVAKEFALLANQLFPPRNFKPMSLHDNPAINAGQMTPNALFTRVQGDGLLPAPVAGKVSGGLVLNSGTVPSGYEIKGLSTSSVDVTIANEPNGYGKVVTFAFTTTAADVVNIIANAPSAASWNLTDNFLQQVDVSVAAGSVNAWSYLEMQINTDLGTDSYYGLYADGSYGPFPTIAYNHTLYSQIGKVKQGSATKGYVNARVGLRFTGAGNMTISLSLPDFERF